MSRFHLITTREGIALEDRLSSNHPLIIDFKSGKLTHRRLHGGKRELLLKAVGAKAGLRVSDWTAGLGTDSLLLATAGCEVTLYERSPVLWLLLSQALQGAKDHPELGSVVSRMNLIKGDAGLHKSAAPEVIYLDPMFPTRKKAARVNGQMQYLQQFLGEDRDADALVRLARQAGAKRVVVKRPSSATQDDATFTLAAKANRFDVYVYASLAERQESPAGR
ncbi:MAG: 16S rRNA (guanine1516-N2)-methyltransferase [Candidatus Azotimanducaceae bacterium]|jgi:16S rRNA (guanine1516-N2)-methyltransferase